MNVCQSVSLDTFFYLTNLSIFVGCCWEEDPSVLQEFPQISRCYRVERTGKASKKPSYDQLVSRSAKFDDSEEEKK